MYNRSIITLLVATLCAGFYPRIPATDSRSTTRTGPLSRDFLSETHCIGRFLIDLPAGAQVRGSYISQGSRVQTLRNVSALAYADTVRARQHELQATLHASGGPMLVERDDVTPNHIALVSWASQISTRIYRHEEYQYVPEEQVLFIFSGSGSATDEARSRAAQTRQKYAQYTRNRGTLEIPTGPGFCFCYGFVEGNALNQEELEVALTFSDPKLANTALYISSFGTNRELHVESRQSVNRRSFPGMKVIRQGKRKHRGLAASERVWKYREDGMWHYRFTLLVPGKSNSLSQPHISLELTTDLPNDDATQHRPPLENDREALHFWDNLVDGFRLRPGAV